MRFEIASVPARKSEKVLRLELTIEGDEAVVTATDDGGNTRYRIISFTRNRQLKRSTEVHPALGFDLDDQGRIVEDDF